MSFESLNLNKQIVSAMQENGYVTVRKVQEKCVNRFAGGQDWVVVGPEGCGKTTTYILAVLMKLKYAFEDAPRALILVSSREKVIETVEQIESLAQNTNLRVVGLMPGGAMQEQRDDLFGGVDIVVGTPDRVSTIYINSGLNINKIQMFIMDDAEYIIKQGFQGIIHRFKDGLPKCQKLCFTEVYHDKMDQLVSRTMNSQGIIEIEEEAEENIELNNQEVYSVLNYKTKLNLLNILADQEDFDKLVIFSNTRLTSGQLYTSVSKRQEGVCAMLNPLFYNQQGVESVEEFMEDEQLKFLFVSNEDGHVFDCSQLTNILHFDMPEGLDLLVSRCQVTDTELEQRFMMFATDIEQIIVKKLENKVGQSFEMAELPLGVVVEGNRKRKPRKEEEKDNGAFHEKKPSNAKTVNMGIKEKMKIHGKARKGSSRFK